MNADSEWMREQVGPGLVRALMLVRKEHGTAGLAALDSDVRGLLHDVEQAGLMAYLDRAVDGLAVGYRERYGPDDSRVLAAAATAAHFAEAALFKAIVADVTDDQ